MIALLVGMAAAFMLSILGTPLIIRILRRNGLGQQIRDDGPFAHPHAQKAGTPTMGGIAIVGSALVGYLVAHVRTEQIRFARAGVTVMALVVGMAIVGFVDDYLGVRRGRNLGLRKRGKMGGQVLVGTGFGLLALQWVNVSTHLSFTRVLDLNMASWIWFMVALLFVAGFSNAVNLTDGMDGLAAGSAAMVFAAFVIIAFWQFRHPHIYHVLPAGALDLAVVAAAMMGACLGFLWWNAAPAQVFMGDVGSLALGAGMAGLALLTNTIMLLPILGGLYVVETLSVIGQVVSFRVFGRRMLRMAPIHHHFEVGGWPEFTVIVRFWLLAGLLVALRARPLLRRLHPHPGGDRLMRIVVIGLGVTGAAVVAYARAAGHDVTVLEDAPDGADYRERAERARGSGAEVVERPDAAGAAAYGAAADTVVPSPGVHPRHPAIAAARAAGVPVRSEIDLAGARLRAHPDAPRLVAITGTNGKTTVTTLVAAMATAAAIPNAAAGNIGRPLLEAVGDAVDVVVAEVSSFQLEFTTDAFAPDVAVLLNVAEDHLDWHGSVEAYVRAKAKIFEHQLLGATLVVNADDPIAWKLAHDATDRVARGDRRVVPFSLGAPHAGGYGVRAGRLVGPEGDLAPVPSSRAPHSVANSLAAAAAARAIGVEASAIERALRDFAGLAHRVELVGEVSGVQFYDDSKATNPHATSSALQGFDHVVLIAGGRNKDLGFGVLRADAARLRAVVAIGEAAAEVEATFAGVVPVVRAPSMREAVREAAACARRRRGAAFTRVRLVRLVRELCRARRRLRARCAVLRRCRHDRCFDQIDAGAPGRASHAACGDDCHRRAIVARARARGDGRGAQPRRRGDGALGVVGRVAHRLRVAVVLLLPAADLDRARTGRVRLRHSLRLSALALSRAAAAHRERRAAPRRPHTRCRRVRLRVTPLARRRHVPLPAE